MWDVGSLQLPYWAMNLEEHCEAFISSTGRRPHGRCQHYRQVPAQGAHPQHPFRQRHITADSPVPYRLPDLLGALEEEAGRLEKLADSSRYNQLRLTIEQFFHDRRYSFIFNAD